MGNHDADRSIVQRGENAVRIRPSNPHEARDVESARAEKTHLERLPGPRRMLLVQHDEVISQRAQDLSRMRRRRLAERADQKLASEQPLAEVSWRGTLRDGSHDQRCLDSIKEKLPRHQAEGMGCRASCTSSPGRRKAGEYFHPP